MTKKLTPLEALWKLYTYDDLKSRNPIAYLLEQENLSKYYKTIEKALKEHENLKEENKMLRENNENLDENYFDTWSACENLKENSNYALMFIDNTYCLVDTKDNKFDVIDNYKINNYGIIDNGTKKKLKALEIIKENIGLKMSIDEDSGDEDTACLYIPLDKNNICIVGYIKGKEKIDLLKEVLK